MLPQRPVDQTGHPTGGRRLDDAGRQRPERVRLDQRLCPTIRTGQTGDRRDQPEDRAESRARARPIEHRTDHDRHQRQRDRDGPDLDAACHGLQDHDQRRQQRQRHHLFDILVFHLFTSSFRSGYPGCNTWELASRSSARSMYVPDRTVLCAQGISSSTGGFRGWPFFMDSHCSFVISSCRGFEPSKPPTIPRSSISSMMRAARA